MRYLSTLFISLCILASCSEHRENLSPQSSRSDKALIFIYRPSPFIDGAVSTEIQIDDAKVKSLPPCSVVSFEATPGEHRLFVRDSLGLGNDIEKDGNNLPLAVEKGRNYYIRYSEIPKKYQPPKASAGWDFFTWPRVFNFNFKLYESSLEDFNEERESSCLTETNSASS